MHHLIRKTRENAFEWLRAQRFDKFFSTGEFRIEFFARKKSCQIVECLRKQDGKSNAISYEKNFFSV